MQQCFQESSGLTSQSMYWTEEDWRREMVHVEHLKAQTLYPRGWRGKKQLQRMSGIAAFASKATCHYQGQSHHQV